MDWLAGKIGTIYQEPAHAIGLSTPPIGCVLDLPGLPGAGNKIYDRSPYGNIGTITGATWTRLPSGLWVLSFDTTDDTLTIPNDAVLSFGNGTTDTPCSIALWAKRTEAGFTIISKYGATNLVREWYIAIQGTRIRFGLLDPGATAVQAMVYADDATSINVWHFIVCTYDGRGDATAANGMTLYEDGVVKPSAATNNAAYVATDNTATDVTIGGNTNISIDAGFIALARIYNRVLSALEIQNQYQQERHLFQ